MVLLAQERGPPSRQVGISAVESRHEAVGGGVCLRVSYCYALSVSLALGVAFRSCWRELRLGPWVR